MAFPRLNMLSVWTLALSSLVLLISFFVPGGAASAGWTGYPPLSAKPIYTGVNWGLNLWILALALEFASFLMGGVNFLTTPINLRAPGMSMFRLPLLVWMQMTAAILFMLSVGPLIAGAVMLLLDRVAGTSFYLPQGGGDPLLWQHLFWFFGHPEVYVIFLPGLGIVLEIFPVFSRKPIFGYRPIIYSTIAAGILSFTVWAHHQFISGMDPRLAMPFSFTTILISVPFALMVFAMIATLWGGSISFPTPMLFALGTLAVFLIGGLTGIFNGSAPVDIYIHSTYFVVAHFHYTLFSALFFAGFAEDVRPHDERGAREAPLLADLPAL
jgi:cytochrome c oxidase subunit 1